MDQKNAYATTPKQHCLSASPIGGVPGLRHWHVYAIRLDRERERYVAGGLPHRFAERSSFCCGKLETTNGTLHKDVLNKPAQ